MAFPNYRSQFGDTTFTKVFVGGLAWETPTDEMRRYFEQFGDILEAVIIADKNTGKSKGYGFVTFRDPESARRACSNPNPVIDGRRANCNIASLGRPRPSPPRARNQGGSPFHGAGSPQGGGGPAYSGSAPPQLLPPTPPPPPVLYNPYGYQTYNPADYGYHHALYNTAMQQPQYYHQMYGTSPSSSMINNAAPNYYYGYSMPATPPRAGSFSPVPAQQPPPHHQRSIVGAPPHSYVYYPNPYSLNVDASRFSNPYHPPQTTTTTTHHFPSPTDSQTQSQQHTSRETEAGVSSSESPNT